MERDSKKRDYDQEVRELRELSAAYVPRDVSVALEQIREQLAVEERAQEELVISTSYNGTSAHS